MESDTTSQPEGKLCKKCKELKPISYFHLNSHFRDGRWDVCMFCRNRMQRERPKERYVPSALGFIPPYYQ